MRRPRSGIAAELVPLALILACLAGSLGLIVAVASTGRFANVLEAGGRCRYPTPHSHSRSPTTWTRPLAGSAADRSRAGARRARASTGSRAGRSDPQSSCEADIGRGRAASRSISGGPQGCGPSKRLASRPWPNPSAGDGASHWSGSSSIRSTTKVRKLETEVDELALERDALEKERGRSQGTGLAGPIEPRPGDLAASRRERDLATTDRDRVYQRDGDPPPARHRLRTPRNDSRLRPGLQPVRGDRGPRGQSASRATPRRTARRLFPYIFFLIRPDGIRSYYEARGRLEPLGITFGYELADQDWEVEFPDLDDIKTWDGSGPSRPAGPDPLAQTPGRPVAGSPAEDVDFPSLVHSQARG